MDYVLAFWTDCLVEETRDEKAAEILGILEGSIPIL